MEASEAPTPTQEAQAPTEAAAEAPQGMDALMARMDELAGQMKELSQPAQAQQEWQGPISDLPFAEGDFAGQPQDQQYADPGDYQPGQYAPEYGLDPQAQQQQAMQQLQEYITEQVQSGVQQALEPHILTQKANELERTYPELANPEKAGEVVREAARIAQRMGRPELARNPELVELAYLAQQARSRAAQQETPADSGDVHLEGAGAAPQAQEMSAGDQMLAAWNIDPSNPWSGQ